MSGPEVEPPPSNGNTPPPRAMIQIVLTQDGQIAVSGPLDDRVTFAGMLDVARELMNEHHRKKVKIMPFRKMP